MIGCGKKVQFVLAWQTYSVGDVIDPPATLRDWLIGRGYVKDFAGAVQEVKSNSGVQGAVTRAIKGAAKRGADLLNN